MSGIGIKIGIGFNNSTPIKINNVNPPEEDISDAILLEGNNGALLMEDGSYFKLETSVIQTFASSSKKTKNIGKSYWNF